MNTSKYFLTKALIVATLALGALTARAHEGHGKPQYGGIVGEAGGFQAELVTKPHSLVIYLTDHGKALSAKGASAKMTMLAKGEKTEAELKPSADGKWLEAAGIYSTTKGTKMVAVITLAGKEPATVRFELR